MENHTCMRPDPFIIHQSQFPLYREFREMSFIVVPTMQELMDYIKPNRHLADYLYASYESAHMWRSLYADADGKIDLMDSIEEFVNTFLYESDAIEDFYFDTIDWTIKRR